MASNPAAMYPLRSRAREQVVASVIITPDGTGTPTVTSDKGGIVSGVTYGHLGILTVTLEDRWSEVVISACDCLDATYHARAGTVVDGLSATNLIYVNGITASTGASYALTSAMPVHMTLTLSRH